MRAWFKGCSGMQGLFPRPARVTIRTTHALHLFLHSSMLQNFVANSSSGQTRGGTPHHFDTHKSDKQRRATPRPRGNPRLLYGYHTIRHQEQPLGLFQESWTRRLIVLALLPGQEQATVTMPSRLLAVLQMGCPFIPGTRYDSALQHGLRRGPSLYPVPRSEDNPRIIESTPLLLPSVRTEYKISRLSEQLASGAC